jgi:hypothetical protein
MKISRIDEFKTAGLNGYKDRIVDKRRREGLPGDSLIGAVQASRGTRAAPQTYAYNDGRHCEHPDGLYHDCAYVDQRNALIPQASRIASSTPTVGTSWDQRFMDAMTALWGAR